VTAVDNEVSGGCGSEDRAVCAAPSGSGRECECSLGVDSWGSVDMLGCGLLMEGNRKGVKDSHCFPLEGAQ
jgi:hypothetical protein